MKKLLFIIFLLFFSLTIVHSQNYNPPLSGLTFTGKLLNGKRNGFGTLEVSTPGINGVKKYEGEWKEDKPIGKFVLNFTNGDIFYGDLTPEFMIDGKGIIEAKNGNSYIGFFKNNKFNGWGMFYFSNPGQYLISNFVSGLPNGPSKIYSVGQGYYECYLNNSFTIAGPTKFTTGGKATYGVIEAGKSTRAMTKEEYESLPLTSRWNDAAVSPELSYQLNFINKYSDPTFSTVVNPFFFKKASLEPPSKWLMFRYLGKSGYMDSKGNVMLRLNFPATNQVVMTNFDVTGFANVQEYRSNFIEHGAKSFIIDKDGNSLIPESMEPTSFAQYPISEVILSKHGVTTKYEERLQKKAIYNFVTKKTFNTLAIDSNRGYGTYEIIDPVRILKRSYGKSFILNNDGKIISKIHNNLIYLPAYGAFIVQETEQGKMGIKDKTFTKWLVLPTFDNIELLNDKKTLIGVKNKMMNAIDVNGKILSATYDELRIPFDFVMMYKMDKVGDLVYTAKKGEINYVLDKQFKEILNLGPSRTIYSQVAGGSFIFNERINNDQLTGIMNLSGKVILPSANYSMARIADMNAGLFTMEMPKPAGDYNSTYKIYKADGSLLNNNEYKLGVDFINGYAVVNPKSGKGSIINTSGNIVYNIINYPDSKGLKPGMYYAGFGVSGNTGYETQYHIQLPSGTELRPRNW